MVRLFRATDYGHGGLKTARGGARRIGEPLADLLRRRLRARTLIAAALALAAHLVLVLLLVFGIQIARAPNEPAPIQVALVKLFAPHPRPATRPPSPPRAQAKSPPAAAPAARPTPAPLPPPQALPENGPIDPRIAAAEAVRGALQATVRCAHMDDVSMSPAERETCARHLRELRVGAPVYFVNADDHMRHDPPVASHGMAAHVGHLSPRPGNDLGPLIGPPAPIAGGSMAPLNPQHP